MLSIPNGTEWIDRPPLKPTAASSPPLIAFHGVMNWDPNLSSAAYLIKKVFPLVRRSLPQARLGIAGGPIPPALAALARQPGVEVLGFVADLRAWLSECHVYAMPMIQGSGVKNKLIEAMAGGLPVVPIRLEQRPFPKRCRKAIVIADGPRALAKAIIDLINDPTRSAILRSEARLAAEREFDWQSLVTRYLEAIESVSQCPSGKSLSHGIAYDPLTVPQRRMRLCGSARHHDVVGGDQQQKSADAHSKLLRCKLQCALDRLCGAALDAGGSFPARTDATSAVLSGEASSMMRTRSLSTD